MVSVLVLALEETAKEVRWIMSRARRRQVGTKTCFSSSATTIILRLVLGMKAGPGSVL